MNNTITLKLFKKKIHAIDEQLKLKNPNLNLFGYDINNKGSKIFYLATHQEFYNLVKPSYNPIPINHYEYYEDDQAMKFVIDIDYTFAKHIGETTPLLDELIDNTLNNFSVIVLFI